VTLFIKQDKKLFQVVVTTAPELDWICARYVVAGWRIRVSPSMSSGAHRSSSRRWLQGLALADAPQRCRLCYWRAFPEVHKAAGQRGGRAGIGFEDLRLLFLRWLLRRLRRWAGNDGCCTKDSRDRFVKFVSFKGSLCKSVDTAGFPVSSRVCVRVLYDLVL
jgi:hypothetical protein